MQHNHSAGSKLPKQTRSPDESIIDLEVDDLDVLDDRWEDVGPTVYDALFVETRPDSHAAPFLDDELDEEVLTRLHETLAAIPIPESGDPDASLLDDLDLIDSILQTGLQQLDDAHRDLDATLARSISTRSLHGLTVESQSFHRPILPDDDVEQLDDADLEDLEELLDPLAAHEADSFRRTIAESSLELDVDDLIFSSDASTSEAHDASEDSISFLDSGIFEIEDVSRALRISKLPPRRVPAPPLPISSASDDATLIRPDSTPLIHVPTTPEARPPTPQPAPVPQHTRRHTLLRAGLDAAARLEVREPWLSWVHDARQEILHDHPRASAEVGALAALARISAGASSPLLTALDVLATELGPPRRDIALYQLIQRWLSPRDELARTLDALATLDASLQTPNAPTRHSAIANARIAQDLLRVTDHDDALFAISQRVTSSQSLAINALIALRSSDLPAAADAWRRATTYAHAGDRDSLAALATALDAHAQLDASPDIDAMSPAQLRMALHLDAWRHDHAREAHILRLLIERDRQEHDPSLLASRSSRLASLMRSGHLPDAARLDPSLSPLALRARASENAPRSLVHARAWEIEARAANDLPAIQSALERQIELVQDPAHRALLYEQLACVHQAAGTATTIVRACFDRALNESPDCLPAVLGFGHIALLQQDWDALLELRSHASLGESPSLDAAWRRAELLWHTHGDAREILSMLRAARNAHPDDPHLYLMMLRAHASLGQWRGVATHAESCRQECPQLAHLLSQNQLHPLHTQLATELYLEELPPNPVLLDELLREHPQPSLHDDEAVLFKLVALDISARDPHHALKRLQDLHDDGSSPSSSARARLWRLYLTCWQLRQPERSAEDWRELLGHAQKPLLRRFAIHGLLRSQQTASLTKILSEDNELCDAWLSLINVPTSQREAHRPLLLAELHALATRPAEACAALATEAIAQQDPWLKAWARERSLLVALRSKLWDELPMLLSVSLPEPERSQRAAMLVHLATCSDAITHVDDLNLHVASISADPLATLSAIEVALRHHDLPQALSFTDRALAHPRRRPDYQGALHMLHTLGSPEPERYPDAGTRDAATSRLLAWAAACPDQPDLNLWLRLCATLRHARRCADEAAQRHARDLLAQHFGPDALDAADAMPTSSDALPQWAAYEAAQALGLTRVMLTAEAASRRWLLNQATRQDTQTLADQALLQADTSGFIDLLAIFALRASSQHASVERLLTSLAQRSQRTPLLSLWAKMRHILHLATVQRCEQDALALCDDPALIVDLPWLNSWRSLLLCALGAPLDAPLTSHDAPGAAAVIQADRAQLANDHAQLLELARAHVPAAYIACELRAANERRDWLPELNLEISHASVRGALLQAPPDEARARFMRLMTHVEPSLLGTPWCPMRLVAHDLHRLNLSRQELELLTNQARAMEGAGPLSEWQLLLARQWARLGHYSPIDSLLPELRRDLVTHAWSLFCLSIDPSSRSTPIQTWIAARWSRIAANAQGPLAAPLVWELGHALQACGRAEDAIKAWRHALDRDPSFGPALVMVGRAFIQQQDWRGLAGLWEQMLSQAKDDPERVGLYMRLSWIYERALSTSRDALERSLWHLQQLLEIDPAHPAGLHAAWRLAYRLGQHEEVAIVLGQLISSTADRELRVAALVELGHVEEHLLGDHERALAAYQTVWEMDPRQHDALWGMLRLEPWGSEIACRAVEATLERSAAEPTSAALGDWLCLVSRTQPRAAYILDQRFASYPVWRLLQLGASLGRGELHEDALRASRKLLCDEQLRALLLTLELEHTTARGGAQQELLEELVATAASHAWSEGLLVVATSRALASRDLDALAGLHGIWAQRAASELEEQLAWLHVIVARAWAGHMPAALQLIEKVLERHPSFLPAVRLATLFAEQQAQWASLARWSQREAELTCREEHAASCRVKASEVQRRYLGDLAAASDQLRLVLQQDPTHAEAFERLRQLLIQRGEVRQLIQISDRWLPRIESQERRIELLNELADLSLNHLQDNSHAIRYLSRSLKEEPRQLRRLRILGELHEQREEYAQAATCYEAAASLAPDAKLRSRLHFQLAQLYEEQLGQPQRAVEHYRQAQASSDMAIASLRAMARVQDAIGDQEGAIDALDALEALVRSPEELQQIRHARLDVAVRGLLPPEHIIQQARHVLKHYPDHPGAADAIRSRLQSIDPQSDLERIVMNLLRDLFAESTHAAMTSHFTLARRWQLDDLSYLIAAVGKWQGLTTRDMLEFHERANLERRWPRRPIPIELTMGLLPAPLSAPFFEVVRRSQDALSAACEASPYMSLIKRRGRLTAPSSEPQQLAFRWPELLNAELRDVHRSEQRLPVGSAAFWDEGVRLILDPQWDRAHINELTALLTKLGPQLAAISMGIGPWAMLGRDAQMFLMSRIADSIVSGWRRGADAPTKLPPWFKLDRFDRWLQRQGRELLAPYVLELTGRLSHAALPQQFMHLELAMERLGCALLPDPSRFLPHTTRLGVELGPGSRPWTFIFDPHYTRLRTSLGTSLG